MSIPGSVHCVRHCRLDTCLLRIKALNINNMSASALANGAFRSRLLDVESVNVDFNGQKPPLDFVELGGTLCGGAQLTGEALRRRKLQCERAFTQAAPLQVKQWFRCGDGSGECFRAAGGCCQHNAVAGYLQMWHEEATAIPAVHSLGYE
jgi:hypothetical protein